MAFYTQKAVGKRVCGFPSIEICKLKNCILKRQDGNQSSLFICYVLHFANGVLAYMFVFNIFCGPFVVDEYAGNDLRKHTYHRGTHLHTSSVCIPICIVLCKQLCFCAMQICCLHAIMTTHDNNHELGSTYSFLGALVTGLVF